MSTLHSHDHDLLIQAELDGELSIADSARLAAHSETCPECQDLYQRLGRVSRLIQTEATTYKAPDALRQAIRNTTSVVRPIWRPRLRDIAGFAVGAALAASLLLTLQPRGEDLAAALVANHVRALQPGHLVDVVSSDQHTVRPWFTGKLDFAPPVRDFADQGFPLQGGRLDYVDGRAVAALVYRHDAHMLDLYVWPEGSAKPSGGALTKLGFNIREWSQEGLNFAAVSDLNAAELAGFAALWQTP